MDHDFAICLNEQMLIEVLWGYAPLISKIKVIHQVK